MHMADALLSPAVGGGFWAVTAGAIGFAARRLRREPSPPAAALAGVLAAFVFSAQMINFAIPGTGSSGHLAGGMLLALTLGPWSGLIAIASVLIVQALFFADGGLLALGANIFNLGVIPCFLAAPLVRLALGPSPSPRRLSLVGAFAAWFSLLLGSLMVVLQTSLSGKTNLPFVAFAGFMGGIHAAIGLVEGAVTAIVAVLIARARPSSIASGETPASPRMVAAIAVLAILTGTVFSCFASLSPDGLEWSIERVAGVDRSNSQPEQGHGLEHIQRSTAVLPDYELPSSSAGSIPSPLGSSVSGFLGGAITFLFVLIAAGVMLAFRGRTVRNDG